MAIYSIERKTVDRVISDLLLKYPTGKTGRVKKEHYRTTERWRPSTDRYAMMVIGDEDLNSKNFGWDIETVVRAKHYIQHNIGSLRAYLREMYPDSGCKSISRKENRLNDRLPEMQKAWERLNDSDAIWCVRLAHSAKVHVIASSEKSAELLGKTVAAGAGILCNDSRYWATKEGPADPEVLDSLRKEQVRRITSTIESNRRRVKELNSTSAALVELCVSLQEFNNHLEGGE
tara:strand:- start:765 stop:1460 length:696 start_codon:yes stop_codon:yes gene_type:complete